MHLSRHRKVIFVAERTLRPGDGERWKDARKQSMQWLRPVSASKLVPRLLCVLTTQICFVRLLTLPSMPEWQQQFRTRTY